MKAYSPTGIEIIATADLVPANCHIQNIRRLPDGSIDFDHTGESELCYNGQYTKTSDSGKTIYVAEDGTEWPEDQLVLRVDIEEIQELAKEARPIDEKDWASDRQITAQNRFIDQIARDFPALFDDEFNVYCLKATTNEMIDRALELVAKAATR